MNADNFGIDYNLALGSNYKAEISGAEKFNFFIQSAFIPNVTISEAPTKFRNFSLAQPGETIEYAPLTFSFIISEDWGNYEFLYKWCISLQQQEQPRDFFKDITIHLMNNNKGPNVRFVFYDAFPTAISDVSLELNVNEPRVLTCTATFKYQYFEIVRS